MAATKREYFNYSGFVDYRYFFPQPVLMWTIIGTILLIWTSVSYCPQPSKLVIAKTSLGLAAFSVLSQAACLWLMLFNVLCLKYEDFIGIFQHLDFRVYARFLTFFNVFLQSTMYSPVPYLLMEFHDKMVNDYRSKQRVISEWRTFVSVPLISMGLYLSCITAWAAVGGFIGFNSNAMTRLGEFAGIGGFAIEMVQFLPQVYTTIKMKNSGSLSVLMLEIQAPVNLMNAFFMWFGNGESWTTYSASLADGGWEFILLSLCLYFKNRSVPPDEIHLEEFDSNMEQKSDDVESAPRKLSGISPEMDENGNPIGPIHSEDSKSPLVDEDGNPVHSENSGDPSHGNANADTDDDDNDDDNDDGPSPLVSQLDEDGNPILPKTKSKEETKTADVNPYK